jgi:hypothetical protein
MMGVAAVLDLWRRYHEVSILIAAGLGGLDVKSVDRMLKELVMLKDNLRRAISANAHPQEAANG